MNTYSRLRKIKKLYFGYNEIAISLGILPQSARVCATRFVKYGFLIRIKRNLYVLRDKWENLDIEQKFLLANVIQVPSYISLTTALGYYGISTQIQQDFFESICIKRTKQIETEKTVFNYTKIKEKLYFGFSRKNGFFIASPEKAFIDAVYLSSINKYSLDETSVDIGKLDAAKIWKAARKFPLKIKELLEKYEYPKKT